MTMSSSGSGSWHVDSELPPITQQCPQDVDESPREGDQSLGVNHVLGAFPVVELSRRPLCFQARESGHVEHPSQSSVIAVSYTHLTLPTKRIV